MGTADSENGTINSYNTVKSLSKIWYRRAGILVTVNIIIKKLQGHANFCLL